MTTVTIPKELSGEKDLVAVKKSMYQEFLAWAKSTNSEHALTPNKATAKRLMVAERNIVTGKNLSPIFNTPQELFKHLRAL